MQLCNSQDPGTATLARHSAHHACIQHLQSGREQPDMHDYEMASADQIRLDGVKKAQTQNLKSASHHSTLPWGQIHTALSCSPYEVLFCQPVYDSVNLQCRI